MLTTEQAMLCYVCFDQLSPRGSVNQPNGVMGNELASQSTPLLSNSQTAVLCTWACLRRFLLLAWSAASYAPMIHRNLSRRCYLHARSPAARLHSGGSLTLQQRNQTARSSLSRNSSEQCSVLGYRGLLTRDFIAKSLYNQDNGYFSTKDVINDLPGPLEFRNMMGELHYRMDVKQVTDSISSTSSSTRSSTSIMNNTTMATTQALQRLCTNDLSAKLAMSNSRPKYSKVYASAVALALNSTPGSNLSLVDERM